MVQVQALARDIMFCSLEGLLVGVALSCPFVPHNPRGALTLLSQCLSLHAGASMGPGMEPDTMQRVTIAGVTPHIRGVEIRVS